ncbi:hypothetical protein [Absidia glauca]|uniref:Uncharacterized protein n=1 Tax=Absidia glauca TaxID=4829 RepID=A0A163LYF7_ABSGL|nr:hypothetical protein [Absidia glauca]
MKFNSLITLSAAALLFQQVLAADATAPSMNGEELSVASGTESVLSSPVPVDMQAPQEDAPQIAVDAEVPNSLEADLIKNLGWSKKDSSILTGFLNAIDQLSTIIGEKAQQNLDQATVDMLAEFQMHARDLIANAGYEYRQGEDNHRVLTRISTVHQSADGLAGTIEKLVSGLVKLLDKLKTSAKDNEALTKLLDLVEKLLKSLGAYLEKLLVNKPAKGGK